MHSPMKTARKLRVTSVAAVILAGMTFGMPPAGAATTTGLIIWTTDLGGVDSSPAVAKGVVYVGSDDDNINGLDAKTGEILWSTDIDGVDSSPAVAKGVVYVGSDDGSIYALNG